MHLSLRGSLALLALATLLATTACGDDFGTACTLPDNDTVKLACEGDGENSNASCVVENIVECDSRLCASYRGSSSFCTLSCSSDSDCPGSAFCAEFVIGTGRKYCVLDEFEGS